MTTDVQRDTRHIGLILLGHGSSIDRRAAEPVYRAAERIRDEFASVRVAFWKEQPSIDDAIESVAADVVVVVPYFMADGYYVTEALPAELGLRDWPERDVEMIGSRRVAYTGAVGSDAAAQTALDASIRESVGDRAESDVAVALVGHGTRRSASSRYSVIEAADALRAQNRFAEVMSVFLDDEPGVSDVFESWSSDVIVVPYMVADGPHVRGDLVGELGLEGFEEFGVPIDTNGKSITLADPLGTRREMMKAVRSRIAEGVQALGASVVPVLTEPSDAAQNLLAAASARPVVLGNLAIAAADGEWRITHHADQDRGAEGLHVAPDRAAWLWWRRNDAGGFRPWISGTDAPTGWQVVGEGESQLRELLAILAPGAIMAWHRARESRLRAFSFAECAGQQSGPLRAARGFDIGRLEEIVGAICHTCARRVVWRADRGVPAPRGGAAESPACERPCGRLLSESARRVRAQAD